MRAPALVLLALVSAAASARADSVVPEADAAASPDAGAPPPPSADAGTPLSPSVDAELARAVVEVVTEDLARLQVGKLRRLREKTSAPLQAILDRVLAAAEPALPEADRAEASRAVMGAVLELADLVPDDSRTQRLAIAGARAFWLSLGRAAPDAGEWRDTVLARSQALVEKFPDEAPSLFLRAQMLEETGADDLDVLRAVAACRKAVRSHAGCLKLHREVVQRHERPYCASESIPAQLVAFRGAQAGKPGGADRPRRPVGFDGRTYLVETEPAFGAPDVRSIELRPDGTGIVRFTESSTALERFRTTTPGIDEMLLFFDGTRPVALSKSAAPFSAGRNELAVHDLPRQIRALCAGTQSRRVPDALRR